MNKQRKTSHILNVFQYDADGHVVLPASLALGIAPTGEDNSGKVPTTAWVRSIVGGAVTAYSPTSRTITINGTSYDLSSNRAWSIDTGVLTASAGSGISVSVVNQNLNIVNTGLLTATSGSGISVSTVNQNLNIVNTGLLTATAGAGISVSTVSQNLNIVNTGLLTATAGSGISVSVVNQNLNVVNTGILTASAGSGISLTVVGQNLNVVNTGVLTATAGAGISLSIVGGNLNVVNTITNNNQLTNGAAYITSSALTGYATETYVGTQISNLVDAAPGTLDTLNELAAALGDDPNFATTVSTSIGTKVPQTRTLTINGTSYDLTANRSWTINSMVYPSAGIALSTGTAWGTSITDNSANWNTAFGWGNHASAGYLASATAATTYVSLTGSYANPSWITSLAYSKITGVPAFLTSYTETDTLASVTGRGASTSTALTLSGKVTFNSSVANRPQMPGGILGLDTSDGNFDIWGISRDYYPSHPTAANAWGLRWNGDNNDFEFVGGGTNRVVLDMDGGNITATGTLSALNYSGTHSGSSSGTNTGDQTNISGLAGSETLATVTGRGATTTSPITINGGGSQPLTLTTASGSPWHLALVRNDLGLTSRVFAHNSPYNGWYFEHNIIIAGNTNIHSGNYNSYSPTLTGGGASGTWGISISGASASATDALRIRYNDGPRNLSDRLPNTLIRTVFWDFVTSGTVGGTGNYAGVMTYAPWDGTSASTGDSSYQLAFLNESGINGSGLPGLRLRKGIDTTWGTWYSFLHAGNYTSYSPSLTGSGASGTWGISITGNAQSSTTTTHLSSRTDGAWYNVIWGAGSPSYLYSSDSVRILSSEGALRANVYYDNQDTAYYLNPAGGSRLRNLYVGDSGDDWSDPGGWGTQVRFSNGPHVRFVLHARTPGIEAGMYVHTPGSVFIGSYTGHDVSMMWAGSRRMQISNSFIYTDVYLEAAGSLRAPIFYDSNDTGYYLDPNSDSNLWRFTAATLNRHSLNSRQVNSPWSTRSGQGVLYQTGAMGWGQNDFNVIGSNWGSGFFDTWSSPGNAPGGSSHYVGIQAFHYSNSDSSRFHGWQMACAQEATNRWFLRSAWDTPRAWVEMIHSGNIGSQSVSYASSAGSANNATTLAGVGISTIRGGISSNSISFYVNGDANTYYPVVLSLGGQFGMNRYSVSRGYSDPAPWDPIGTGSHRGGLTLTFDASSDIAWGGNDKSWRIIQFSESYTNMVAGMALPVTDGIIVWLRGGGAYYTYQGPSGINHAATVYLSGYTGANGATYPVRTSLSNVDSEIRAKWPVRGFGDGDMYVSNQAVIHTGNLGSQTVFTTLYHNGSTRLYTGSDGTRNTGWAYHTDNGSGLHWPNNGWHLMPASNSDFRVHSGSSSESTFRMETNGTTRGYMYANSSNEIGFLNNGRSWTFRVENGGRVVTHGPIARNAHSSGFLEGSYNNIGGNAAYTNPIYTIGSSYNPTDSSLSNMYGIGYAHPNLWGSGKTPSWGLYVCEAGGINATIGGGAVTIWASNDIVAYSDIRVKDNIEVVTNAIEKIQAIRGVTFTRTDANDKDRNKRHAGVIAQEVLKVLPEVVSGTEEDMYSVAYGNMAALFIEAIKEQQKQIEELQNKLDNVLSSR